MTARPTNSGRPAPSRTRSLLRRCCIGSFPHRLPALKSRPDRAQDTGLLQAERAGALRQALAERNFPSAGERVQMIGDNVGGQFFVSTRITVALSEILQG